jgi:hypothetical protein
MGNSSVTVKGVFFLSEALTLSADVVGHKERTFCM